MNRIWILVPFWVFLLAYLVYKMNGLQRGERISKAHVESPVLGSTDSLAAAGSAIVEKSISLPPPPSSPVSAAELEELTSSARSELFLIPRDAEASPVSFLWPVDHDGPALPALLRHAHESEFETWKPYSDEWISFYYPDDPEFELEVVDGSVNFPMIGEAMWTIQDDAFRRYLLNAGDLGTVCAISLERTSKFDDTERFPHEELFQRFMTHRGMLCRASVIDTGQVRRFQFLADDLCVSVLDWPHCAMHQDAYVRMALSIAPRVPTSSVGRIAKWARDQYGFDGALGFLEKGMAFSEINALLGQAEGVAGDMLVYLRPGAGGNVHYRLVQKDGKLVGFDKNWRVSRRDPPIDGSLDWMLEKTESTAGASGSVGYDLGSISDEDAAFMFERFLSTAPSASPRDWKTLCRVLANLCEMKLHDNRILSVIRARFLEPGLSQSHAIQVLHAYDADGAKDLYAERIRYQLGESADTAAENLQILFAYLGRGYSGTAALLESAMAHGNPDVRGIAYGFWEWLPETTASMKVFRGLDDESAAVRRRSAEAICEGCGGAHDHIPMLEERLLGEEDAETRHYLVQALARLRGLGAKSG